MAKVTKKWSLTFDTDRKIGEGDFTLQGRLRQNLVSICLLAPNKSSSDTRVL